MKVTLCIYVLLMFCFSFGQNENTRQMPSYLVENNLKGNIIEYSEMQYFDPNAPLDKYNNKTTYKLDFDGKLLEQVSSGLTQTFAYSDGVRTHKIRNYNNDVLYDGNILIQFEDNVLKETYYNGKELHQLIEQQLDSNNRLVWKHEQNFSMSRNYYDVYEYIGDTIVSITSYDKNSKIEKPTLQTIETLDKYGNVISRKRIRLIDNEIIPEEIFKYVYDHNGNWTIQYWFSEKEQKPFMKSVRTYVYQ